MMTKEKVSKIDIDVLTVEALNQLPCEQITLLLLRALNTSDLTFHYMILNESTVCNICDMADGMLEFLDSEGHDLSTEQQAEYLALIENMRHYGGHSD